MEEITQAPAPLFVTVHEVLLDQNAAGLVAGCVDADTGAAERRDLARFGVAHERRGKIVSVADTQNVVTRFRGERPVLEGAPREDIHATDCLQLRAHGPRVEGITLSGF